jgi:poly(hydroxyalkanoate) depolymerase family esterase
MFSWSLDHVRRLRTWLLVRFGLWRGQWRRGRVLSAADVRLVPWALPVSRARRWWRYGLYAPPGLRDDEPAPLVVLLHGCRQRALSFTVASGWTRFADRAAVRLLCPEQRRLANILRCWNWFHPQAQSGRGELDAILAMIDDAASRMHVDATRVAAVGLSAGGALATLLAFHHPARFRAVVAVAAPPLLGNSVPNPHAVMQRGLALDPLVALGTLREACAPLAIVHGSADKVVAPRCAEQLLAQALESLRRAGLQPTPTETAPEEAGIPSADYRVDSKLVLRSVLISDAGHAWTGGPGGHPYCERGGVQLTALCGRFLRDAGLFESSPARRPTASPGST